MIKQSKYLNSGVNVELANKLALFLKNDLKTTDKRVLTGIGGFASIYDLSDIGKNPCIVSCTDGVGTKLKIAFMLDKHDTVGIDLVAMSANDLAAVGAAPLYFLDYIASGTLKEDIFKNIIKGIKKGCGLAQMSLIGGETAEMPGSYPKNEYDLAGFATGWVEKDKIIDGKKIKSGDIIIGLQSNGVHSNGYSLIRKLIEDNKIDLSFYEADFSASIGEELLKPTTIYTKAIQTILKFDIHAICHITGGGIFDNIGRVLEGRKAVINRSNIPKQAIFSWLSKLSGMDDNELYSTWNMGVGMVLITGEQDAADVIKHVNAEGINSFKCGFITDGEGVEIA